MPKSKNTSDFEHGRIVGLWEAGKSLREIEDITGHSKSTIHDIVAQYREEGQETAKTSSGREHILSDRNTRYLVRTLKDDRKQSLEEMTEKFNESLGLSVSSSTVRNYLHEMGYHGRVGKRKPLVSEKNRVERLAWCRERKNWSDEWNSIIWSDESRFELFQNDSHHWVWRRPEEEYDVDCLIPTVKSGRDGVMMWGCFVYNRLGPLVEVSGKINGQRYREVLHDHLLPFLNELGDESIYYFQDDNAPSHSAKETIRWKEDNLIPSIPWPAQSPDLNPIEHLWDVLEKKLRSRKPLPKNKIELIDALNEEWLHIEPRITENLVLSMPRRVKAVIESHGNPTLY
jgi:transposase